MIAHIRPETGRRLINVFVKVCWFWLETL